VKRTLFHILLFAGAALQAQTGKQPVTQEHFYVFGGKNFEELRSVKELPGKQYMMAGTTSSFGQGNTSAYLVKTDSLGKHAWSMAYGGSQNDWAYSVEVTPDSGCFVAGFTNSFNPGKGYDGWYFKIDKTGFLQWQRTVSGDDWDFIYASAPDWAGGYLLCGETYSNSNGSADAWLLRVNSNGDTLWTRHFGGAKDEKFNSVCVIGNRIYAVGINYSTSTDSAGNGWIVKMDTSGNFISESLIMGLKHESEAWNGITAYNANSFVVTGQSELLDSNAMLSIVARMDTALAYTAGPYYSFNTSPGTYVSYNQAIKMSYGNLCVLGTSLGGLGGLNMFFVGLDGNLNFISDYAHNCGQQFDDYGYAGIYTSSGRLVLVGSSQQVCPTNPGLGLEDAFAVRFESDSITNAGIAQTLTNCFADTLPYWAVGVTSHSPEGGISLYPNPAADEAAFMLGSASQVEVSISVFNALGREALQLQGQTNRVLRLDLSTLPNGVYFLQAREGNGVARSLKLIISK
jgi:hypothetical protein